MMKPVTLPGIDDYAAGHTTADGDLLRGVAERTRAAHPRADMLSGPVVARFLEACVRAVRPRTVLEVGTFTGYSALAMASALPEGGRLITCEADPDHAAIARANIGGSDLAGRITIEVGPALETIDRLEGPFDFVFLDAAKTEYAAYLEAVLPRLAPSGLLAADNTLWDGEVLDAGTADPDALALREFNRDVATDPRLVAVLLTIRDGITLIWPREPGMLP